MGNLVHFTRSVLAMLMGWLRRVSIVGGCVTRSSTLALTETSQQLFYLFILFSILISEKLCPDMYIPQRLNLSDAKLNATVSVNGE